MYMFVFIKGSVGEKVNGGIVEIRIKLELHLTSPNYTSLGLIHKGIESL